MGIFNFIRNAGAKVFGAGKETKHATAKVTGGEQEINERMENEKAARKLEDTIHNLQLEVKDLKITIENDKATISGLAEDQATLEKVVLVVGNVEGIGQVDNKMEVEKEEPESVFHTVERGDTLGKIAEEHYGSVNRYQEIFEANKPLLSSPDKIYPGQVLRIPALEKK